MRLSEYGRVSTQAATINAPGGMTAPLHASHMDLGELVWTVGVTAWTPAHVARRSLQPGNTLVAREFFVSRAMVELDLTLYGS